LPRANQQLLRSYGDRYEQEAPSLVNQISSPQPQNRTGLPDGLRAELEKISGFDLSNWSFDYFPHSAAKRSLRERFAANLILAPIFLETLTESAFQEKSARFSQKSRSKVRVHYNSLKPARLNAHAYTQGQEIEIGPGQERYLSHEAWHVIQQMQGRVKPTIQIRGAKVNDEEVLESEADMMSAKAREEVSSNFCQNPIASVVTQRKSPTVSQLVQRHNLILG
jgi:hypothetical protein